MHKIFINFKLIKNICLFNIHKIDFFLTLNHYTPMLSRYGRSTFSYKSHDARSHMMLSHMRSCAILHRRCKPCMRDPTSMKESCFLWYFVYRCYDITSVQVQRAHRPHRWKRWEVVDTRWIDLVRWSEWSFFSHECSLSQNIGKWIIG